MTRNEHTVDVVSKLGYTLDMLRITGHCTFIFGYTCAHDFCEFTKKHL